MLSSNIFLRFGRFFYLYMLSLVARYFKTPIRAPRLVHLSSYSHIARMDSTAVDEPKNVHYSVDPSGKTVMDLSFASEPLGLPASDGYGWPQFQAGESIGPENRYLLSRKLGWGMSSSTWLSRDQKHVSSHYPRASIEFILLTERTNMWRSRR